MVLITCPDCHLRISPGATSCPHCGHSRRNQNAGPGAKLKTIGTSLAIAGMLTPALLVGFHASDYLIPGLAIAAALLVGGASLLVIGRFSG